jgi:hypothetical protein
MSDRKIIFECVVGSKLYGTNRPESDEDYQGVFLPSTADLLGMQNCPTEWTQNVKLSEGEQNTKGDVDRKCYSLKRFIHLAMEGQPGQLELLFSPSCTVYSPEWFELIKNTDKFLSKKAIAPFMGFAKSQSYKASLKGQTLNQIRAIIKMAENRRLDTNGSLTLAQAYTMEHGDEGSRYLVLDVEPYFDESHTKCLEIWLPLTATVAGTYLIEVGGRAFDLGIKVKSFIESMRSLESKYGERSNAAAKSGYDWKSLTHAYRLMFEGEEFLQTGKITFPVSGKYNGIDRLEFLKAVRAGGMIEVDHHQALHDLMAKVREAEAASTLPEEPDYKWAEQFCQEILAKHLGVK